MLFSSVPAGIEQRFIDISHQAVDSDFFSHSLGFRSQALKLKFVAPDTPGYFMKPRLSFDQVISIFEERFELSLPKPVYHQAHIGESISLIYSPYYVKHKIYDAVLNESIPTRPLEHFDLESLPGGPPDWKIKFLPTLCPSCGWDLEGEKDSLALICKNCSSAWQSKKNKLDRLKFAYIPDTGDDMIYLPFWRIKADVSEIKLNSYADLVKLANMPKVIRKEMEEVLFNFWSPAFKIRPQTFMPLAVRMTLTQPKEKLVNKFPDADIYPVTLPIDQAIESLKTILSDFIKPRRIYLPEFDSIEITPKSYLLVYIAFHRRHQELFQPICNYTIRKNQMKFAKNL